MGLTGWVRNLTDGRVETEVTGEKNKIEDLLKLIEKGSFFADVKSVQVEWINEQAYTDFTIIK